MSDFQVLLAISGSPFESTDSVIRLPVEPILLLERLILGISRNTTLLGSVDDDDYLSAVVGSEDACSIFEDVNLNCLLQLFVQFVDGLLEMLRLFEAKPIVEDCDHINSILLVGDFLET